MSNILYLGQSSTSSSSGHRARALGRLGHNVIISDPYKAFEKQLKSRWMGPLHFRSGYRLLTSAINRWMEEVVKENNPDLVWVNSGELFGPATMNTLKRLARPIVLYNNDDPTGGRDGHRFDLLLKSLQYYDLAVVMREVNVDEYKKNGAPRVIREFMSYDEEFHRPFSSISEVPQKFKSEVAFIGTWMRYEKRDEFLLELIQQGIPVSIWGNRWEKSPHFAKLKSHWRGNALAGRDYVAALQGAKICLGLLSKGNRDMHTMRSLETPFAGGLICAERTPEHQEMYKEGVEAVFWSDARECAEVCKRLLANDDERESIRLAGMKRVLSLKAGNEDVCRRVLENLKVEI